MSKPTQPHLGNASAGTLGKNRKKFLIGNMNIL